MNKGRKKNKYNKQALLHTAHKLGVSKVYVEMCLRGDRRNETAEIIKKEYATVKSALESATHKVLKQHTKK